MKASRDGERLTEREDGSECRTLSSQSEAHSVIRVKRDDSEFHYLDTKDFKGMTLIGVEITSGRSLTKADWLPFSSLF